VGYLHCCVGAASSDVVSLGEVEAESFSWFCVYDDLVWFSGFYVGAVEYYSVVVVPCLGVSFVLGVVAEGPVFGGPYVWDGFVYDHYVDLWVVFYWLEVYFVYAWSCGDYDEGFVCSCVFLVF